MNISVTMHIDGISPNQNIDNLSNEELKNIVLMAKLGGIVIDIKSITQIHNELWDDRKGGPRCDLAWDQEFCEALEWHAEMNDEDDDE
jgi:hypothetical protein